MKPLKSELQDADALRELGSASVQIVHDLKNQLNGLKLYATFLRKRMEKGDRPADELETISKLIAGLERAAGDMTTLVRLGRPLELQLQPGADLKRLLAGALGGHHFDAEDGSYAGDFDAPLLTEALKTITACGRAGEAAAATDADAASTPEVRLRRDEAGDRAAAVVEWRGSAQAAESEDVFRGYAGAPGLRMAFAARIVRAHGGEAAQEADTLRVRLPLAG